MPFIPGDVFDEVFLAPAPIPDTPPTDPLPDLHALKSLTPLHGRLSAIFASAFFHLFDEAGQLALAKRLASLLLPEPGSFIFGLHVGYREKGVRTGTLLANQQTLSMFCHSPESWTKMWVNDVFGEGKVKVEATLREVSVEKIGFEGNDLITIHFLLWSVTRL